LRCSPVANLPTDPEELAALDYGRSRKDYEKIVRDYLRTAHGADFALIEFKAGPKPLYQKETVLRERQYGWAVCVLINDKDRRGAYEGFYPMVLYIRHGKSRRGERGRTGTPRRESATRTGSAGVGLRGAVWGKSADENRARRLRSAVARRGDPDPRPGLPKGPVTLVIPLAPGDATDTSARAIAEELSRELKVAIVR